MKRSPSLLVLTVAYCPEKLSSKNPVPLASTPTPITPLAATLSFIAELWAIEVDFEPSKNKFKEIGMVLGPAGPATMKSDQVAVAVAFEVVVIDSKRIAESVGTEGSRDGAGAQAENARP